MTAHANAHRRPFLDATDAETTVDLGALEDNLSDAVRDAEKLGLVDVKEHLDAALDGVERTPVPSNGKGGPLDDA